MDINEDTGEVEAPKKKAKLTIQEKLNSLNCYRNLLPDEHSAPAHIVRELKKPVEDSKRQLRKKQVEAKKFKSILEKKKINDKENLLLATDMDSSKFNKLKAKQEKDTRLNTKLEATLKTEFTKDIWSSKHLNSLFIFKFKLFTKFNKIFFKGSDLPEINHTNIYYLRSTKKLGVKVNFLFKSN